MAPLLESIWIVPMSVFVAGLIGSPHCLSMCGPIALNFSKSHRDLAFYQLGRMISYVTLGAIFGGVGKSVFGQEQSLWISGLSLIVVAVLLIANGYRTMRGQSLHFPLPKSLSKLSELAWRKLPLRSMPKPIAGFTVGILTVLLPCGHLYSFLVGAIATGSAAKGAGFMFAFWLGSTPLLSFGPLWIKGLIQRRSLRAQRIAGALLVGAGLFSVLTFGARSFELYQERSSARLTPEENFPPRCH